MNGTMRKRILTAAALGALVMPMAFSGMAQAATDTAGVTVSAENMPVLEVTIPAAKSLGQIDPNGGTNGESGVVSFASAETGARWISAEAQLLVESNEDYTVGVAAAAPTAPDGIDLTDLRIYLDEAPDGYGTAGSTGDALSAPKTNWAAGAPNNNATHNAYFGLNVEWADETGNFSSVVTFTVTQS